MKISIVLFVITIVAWICYAPMAPIPAFIWGFFEGMGAIIGIQRGLKEISK